MPKKNRVAIYEYLFKEGVMVAKKDYHAPKHPELENIPNLQVIKAMQVIISIFFFPRFIQDKILLHYELYKFFTIYIFVYFSP